MSSTHLGVFAKYWTPGSVKTRLASDIGASAAADFHRECVVTLTRRMATVAGRRTLVYAPISAADEFRSAVPLDWELCAQSTGDLGERLQAFFAAAFADKAQYVVVLGSDSPTLPRPYVLSAFQCLQTHDCVLGPSADGGYYLIGMANRTLPVFQDIPWSSPQTLVATRAKLLAIAARWAELPLWYDVDELSDLLRLQTELKSGTATDEFASLRLQVAAAIGGC